jgi:hypothetical protein
MRSRPQAAETVPQCSVVQRAAWPSQDVLAASVAKAAGTALPGLTGWAASRSLGLVMTILLSHVRQSASDSA